MSNLLSWVRDTDAGYAVYTLVGSIATAGAIIWWLS